MVERTARFGAHLTLLDRVRVLVQQRARAPSELLEAVVAELARACGADRVFVAVLHPREPFCWIEAGAGIGAEERRRASFRPGEGVVGRVIESGQPIADDTPGGRYQRFAGMWPPSDAIGRRYLCVPVLARGSRPIAALCLDRRGRAPLFMRDELELLSVVAELISRVVLAARELREEAEERERELSRLRELAAAIRCREIGCDSQTTRHVLALAQQLAPSGSTPLITGESGVGKELVAREIHAQSPRAHRPFVCVQCETGEVVQGPAAPAAPERAAAGQRAWFTLATGGTLLLDELGELPPALQLELLHTLHELGPGKGDVRLIATTRADLDAAVRAGRFRADLYYRLNMVPIRVLPLRERRDEVPALARHFVARFAALHGRDVKDLSPEAHELLVRHDWPGNVRELENCISRAVLLAGGPLVTVQDLPRALQSQPERPRVQAGTLKQRVAEFERSVLVRALDEAGGNQALAARALQTTPRVLGYRLRKLGVIPARSARSG